MTTLKQFSEQTLTGIATYEAYSDFSVLTPEDLAPVYSVEEQIFGLASYYCILTAHSGLNADEVSKSFPVFDQYTCSVLDKLVIAASENSFEEVQEFISVQTPLNNILHSLVETLDVVVQAVSKKMGIPVTEVIRAHREPLLMRA